MYNFKLSDLIMTGKIIQNPRAKAQGFCMAHNDRGSYNRNKK